MFVLTVVFIVLSIALAIFIFLSSIVFNKAGEIGDAICWALVGLLIACDVIVMTRYLTLI